MRTVSINRLVIYIALVLSSFLVYFCLDESSYTVECMILFGILLLSKLSNRTVRLVSPIVCIVLFLVVSLALSGRLMERGSYNIPWKFAVKFIHLLFAVIAGYAVTSLSSVRKRKVVISALVSIVLSSIISLYYVIFVNNEALRLGSQIGISETFSFDQIYGVVVLIPSLLLFYIKKRKLVKNNFIFTVAIAIIFVCVLSCALTTAILLVAIGIALIYMYEAIDRKKMKTIILWILLILALFVVYLFRSQIGDFIYGLTYNLSAHLKVRLQRVIDIVFATEHTNTYTMDRRFELAGYSINTFISHPLFGVGISGIEYGVIGYHQEWPDVLGVCGVVGTIIIASVFCFVTRTIYKCCEHEIDRKCMLLGVVMFIILGFFNPCLAIPELYALYVILPNISSLCTKDSLELAEINDASNEEK